MKRDLTATFMLILIALLWGSTYPLIKNTIAHIGVYEFVSLRFFFAAAILLPFAWRALKSINRELLITAAILGILNGSGYIVQTIGLQTLPAAQAAFIVGIYVVLVPLVAPLFGLGKPTKIELIATLFCLFGLFILTGANLNTIKTGDGWELLAALLFALAVAYLQHGSSRVKNNIGLTFLQLIFIFPIGFMMAKGDVYNIFSAPDTAIGIFFFIVVCTCFTFYLQTRYQQQLTPAKVAMIFCLEPIFAGIVGFLINGTAITPHMIIGGTIMLFSIVMPFVTPGKLITVILSTYYK